MRTVIATLAMLCLPALSYAQAEPRAYVSGAGGFATTSEGTSGDVLAEAGVRFAPNLFVFGNVGKFNNLAPTTFQPDADAIAADFAASGVVLDASTTVPAWYSIGGVRFMIPVRMAHMVPYVFGGAGFAHLMPSARFVYSSGTLPGASPAPGDDVTAELVSLGEVTPPSSSNAFMFSAGGGVDVPLSPRVGLNVGYRLSRVNADTPLTAQGVTFGVGYRF